MRMIEVDCAYESNRSTTAAQPHRCGRECRHSCSRPFRLAMKSVLHWSIGVVKRCEIDSMPCSNCLHLRDPLRSDESSSLREGFEAALESKSHAFEQASMDHIGERMAIQN